MDEDNEELIPEWGRYQNTLYEGSLGHGRSNRRFSSVVNQLKEDIPVARIPPQYHPLGSATVPSSVTASSLAVSSVAVSSVTASSVAASSVTVSSATLTDHWGGYRAINTPPTDSAPNFGGS